MTVLLLSIDRNVQTTSKIKNCMIFKLTKRSEIFLIMLVINLRKILKRIIMWWENKVVVSSSSATALRNLKKRAWRFFVLTNFGNTLTSAKTLSLFKILISWIYWIIRIQIKKIIWINILLFLSILFHRNLC